MRFIKPLVSMFLLGVLIWVLNSRIGIVPPLGKLLSPSIGLWQNSESKDVPRERTIAIPGIRGKVQIRYDSNWVPHIFADNEHDLYLAQGYVTAKDRLWQMDMQVRTASGGLSEILGMRTIDRDIFYRRLGLSYAAQMAFDSVQKDPVIWNMLEAYTAGVNAYIDGLSPAQYPVEFKIFDYKPQEWKPINSLLILKLTAEKLTGGEPEFGMTNFLARFGADTTSELFNGPYSCDEPVVPKNTAWDFKPVRRPDPPANSYAHRGDPAGMPHRTDIPGSNNWAVAGNKSATGYPLLANDPHLELTLPSIWYQQQLQAPGLNVYGVSIAGIPSIMIGFNNNIAWGLTNTTADVADWYHIKFRDDSKKEYLYDGKWYKIERHLEKFRMRSGKIIQDTILYTRQGPVVYEGRSHRINSFYRELGPSEGMAMRWTMHEVSNDLKTFYLLDRAKDYEDYRKALTYFNCPAQNFVYAGSDNSIAITCDGKLPIRYKNQGEFVLDGTSAADDWHGWIPMDELPFSKDPARGFVSSANQALTDSTYPYYIGGHFASFARAKRINERLAGMNRITVDSCRVLQNDAYSEFAAGILPFLLDHLDRSSLQTYQQILNDISGWNYTFERNAVGATIFTIWWEEIYNKIWNTAFAQSNIRVPWPDYDRTATLLRQDSNAYPVRLAVAQMGGNLRNFITLSFRNAIDAMGKKYGNIGEGWKWGYSRNCFVGHIGNIPSFGIGPYTADGSPNTVNALSDRFGPSWRMVVQLGPSVTGYGVLPGGQSGNPGSPFYDNLFSTWREGKLNKLVFFSPGDVSTKDVLSTLTFKK